MSRPHPIKRLYRRFKRRFDHIVIVVLNLHGSYDTNEALNTADKRGYDRHSREVEARRVYIDPTVYTVPTEMSPAPPAQNTDALELARRNLMAGRARMEDTRRDWTPLMPTQHAMPQVLPKQRLAWLLPVDPFAIPVPEPVTPQEAHEARFLDDGATQKVRKAP